MENFIMTKIKNVETERDVDAVLKASAIISISAASETRTEILLNTGQAVDSADNFDTVTGRLFDAMRENR